MRVPERGPPVGLRCAPPHPAGEDVAGAVGIRRIAKGMGAALLAAIAPVAALGQDAAVEVEEARAGREAAGPLEATEAARASLLFGPLREGDRVDFSEVLEHPDDLDRNLRLARTQIAEGDLLGASATLERILLLEPGLAEARLLRAVVLLRLDDLLEAERELSRLLDGPLDPGSRSVVDAWLDEVQARRRRTRVHLSLATGLSWDDNRGAAPASGSVLLFDRRFRLGDGGRPRSDVAALGSARLEFERDLGLHEGHRLAGGVSVYASKQDELDRFDLKSAAADLAAVLNLGAFRVEPRLRANLVDLSSEKFVRRLGASLGAERALGPRLAWTGELRSAYVDYDGIPGSRRAHEYTGFDSGLAVGLRFDPSPVHRLELRAGPVLRSAERRYYGYAGVEAELAHTWLLGGGAFLRAGASMAWRRYKDAQDLVSRKIRRDLLGSLRLGVGAPLRLISLGRIGGEVGEVVVSIDLEHFFASSNLPNYTWRSRRVGLLVSRRFELGGGR